MYINRKTGRVVFTGWDIIKTAIIALFVGVIMANACTKAEMRQQCRQQQGGYYATTDL